MGKIQVVLLAVACADFPTAAAEEELRRGGGGRSKVCWFMGQRAMTEISSFFAFYCSVCLMSHDELPFRQQIDRCGGNSTFCDNDEFRDYCGTHEQRLTWMCNNPLNVQIYPSGWPSFLVPSKKDCALVGAGRPCWYMNGKTPVSMLSSDTTFDCAKCMAFHYESSIKDQIDACGGDSSLCDKQEFEDACGNDDQRKRFFCANRESLLPFDLPPYWKDQALAGCKK